MEIYKIFTAKGEPAYYINRLIDFITQSFELIKKIILFIINVEKKI
jgi:hypothetical protein